MTYQPREPTKLEMSARKDDAGKVRLDLLPPVALAGVARVFQFGAEKYGAYNYRKGMATSRLYASALRHLFAYWNSEDADPESGQSHLAHAACCVLMLLDGVNYMHDDRSRMTEED